MKTKKLLSLLLALMMMLSVVPMYASAADPIALTASNVTEWPTANGSIYFGQKISDGVTLSGGEVQYNGTTVAGHFEFIDSALVPTIPGTQRSNIKFVPDDETSYIGFEKSRSRDVTYDVLTVTPVFEDEENNPLVATEVEAGAELSTSILSGGKVINPYNVDEPNILAATWSWESSTTIVQESGYYTARIVATGYDALTTQVYVRLAGEIPETTIVEVPTVDTLTYDGVTTWGDVELKGGKAVLKIEGTEVVGTFAVTEYWKTRTVNIGSYEIDVTFTPDDPEAALPRSFKIPVTVNKAVIKFVDEAGTETIPEITIPYGLKMGDDLNGYLRPYLNTSASLNFTETEYYNSVVPVGTHDLTVKASCSDVNYESNAVLSFKVTIEPAETAVAVKFDVNDDNKNTYDLYVAKADVDGLRPQGTFALYVDGQLLKDGVAFGEHVTWTPENSRSYALKAVYTAIDNDPCLVSDVVSTVDVKLYRKVTTINTSADGEKEFRHGEVIRIVSNIPEFSGWVITDASGNEVDLGIDTTTSTIEFAVPDYDITIEAKANSSTGGDDSTGGIFDGLGDLTQGDSDNPIVNIFNNIIAWFKNIINTIIEVFRSIGNNS